MYMYFHRTIGNYGVSIDVWCMCVHGVRVHVRVAVCVCVLFLSIVMGQKTQAGRANIMSRTPPSNSHLESQEL